MLSIKPFKYKKLPNRKVQIELINLLAKYYKKRIYWIKRNMIGSGFHAIRRNSRGYYEYIGMDSGLHRHKLSTFFHELGHSYCFNNGIWKSYHYHGRIYRGDNDYYYRREGLRAMIRTGYKAEQWVDRWAKAEMAKWFPHLKYRAGYTSKKDKKWYNTYFMDYFRNRLKKLNESSTKINNT